MEDGSFSGDFPPHSYDQFQRTDSLVCVLIPYNIVRLAMYLPSRSSAAVVLPIMAVAAVLHYHNPAYIPAAILVALGVKQSFFPPLLRPLSQPEATSRLKFNLFLLLHLTIGATFFPPTLSLRRGLIWYIDEYVQGRRGGQKSWALSGIKAFGTYQPQGARGLVLIVQMARLRSLRSGM